MLLAEFAKNAEKSTNLLTPLHTLQPLCELNTFHFILFCGQCLDKL